MKIQVEVKNVYGTELIYPVCDKAKLFGNIAGTKTLTMSVLRNIERLGYQIELVVDPKFLKIEEEVL